MGRKEKEPKLAKPRRPIREDDIASADSSPFDPIVIDDPDVRQALSSLGILRNGRGQLEIKGISSNKWE